MRMRLEKLMKKHIIDVRGPQIHVEELVRLFWCNSVDALKIIAAG